MFKIGDKVVFMPPAKEWFSAHHFMVPLNNEIIYKIRGFDVHSSTKEGGMFLEGIINKNGFDHFELSYWTFNFRKIDEQFATDTLADIEEEINQQELVRV